jgi:hypothetical protein
LPFILFSKVSFFFKEEEEEKLSVIQETQNSDGGQRTVK